MIPIDQISAPPPPWGPHSPPGSHLWVIGVDIGQIRDFSAICAVTYDIKVDPTHPGDPLMGEPPQYLTHYTCLGAERLALGTPYPQVAARMNQIAGRLYDRDSKASIHVLADATGCGRPVIDQLRDSIALPQAVHVTAVTITSGDKGDESILWRQESRVSKSWLVSRLQATLQTGRLHLPRDEHLAAMIEELKRYEIKVRPQGSLEMGVPDSTGEHDDLATSLALACSAQYQQVHYDPYSFSSLPSPF